MSDGARQAKAGGRSRAADARPATDRRQTPQPHPQERMLELQRTAGNAAVSRALEPPGDPTVPDTSAENEKRPATGILRLKGGIAAVVDDGAPEKSVDDSEESPAPGIVEKNGGPKAPPVAPPKAPVKAKKAGVASFVVKWSKNAKASPTNPNLRLDYTAKFKKDADHDPALAEFRQSVMTKFEVTAGPNKGLKGDTSPMHDDHYSRADDIAGNAITSVNFQSNDNPGFKAGTITKDDVLDYSFTAEDTIIDTSLKGAVIARRGPHTGTIKGKGARSYGGVPKTLS